MVVENRSDEVLKRLNMKTYPSISINRVPQPVFDGFKKLAEEEFCNDFGFTLKFLWDFYSGVIPAGTELLEAELAELKTQVKILTQKVSEKKQEKIEEKKGIDGTVRR